MITPYKFTLERVGTAVGSNSSQQFGSIGTQTRPGKGGKITIRY
jgi:hypothetical protein